ncbi:MAG: imidazolonepropionase [Robiginitomaculum sp.]
MKNANLYINCALATMTAGTKPYGLIEDGAFVTGEERILWVGARANIPKEYESLEGQSLGGRVVTPALIDCHTHLVFGGNRAGEFALRAGGASYAEIARAGGGILSTVKATRAASEDELIGQALPRLDALIAEGVAVIEIKSGYGLTIESEIKMLKIARKLGDLRGVKIVTTWLAAHAVAPEYKGCADAYIDEVVIAGLERAHGLGLVDAVDGFCETIGFSPSQMERVFKKAKVLGLPVKLHAEQLSDQKGAVLAAKYGALSADHLEYFGAADAAHLAKAGTVSVLLPGAFYTLKETRLPPIDALRAAGVDMAVATDCNPGSSPLSSLLMAMNMAGHCFGLTPEESLIGTTRAAALALGLGGEYGIITKGARAELAVWNINHPCELAYWMGGSPLERRITARSITP